MRQPVLSLACTSVNLLFGWRPALRYRRRLGLRAFACASGHLLVLVGLDYASAFRLPRAALTGMPFIRVGTAALLILAGLAGTSFPVWKKRLHRLAYLALLLGVVHCACARKGNLTALRGDILPPLAI